MMAPRAPRHDPTELVILAVLSEEPLYGYAITKRVAARSEGEFKISPGVLYPLLNSLERQKMIVSTWETVRSERAAPNELAAPGVEPPGRKRKWYKLSARGRKRLEQHVQAHRAYLTMIASFLGPSSDPSGSPAGQEPLP
ncbi:MAG: helix-turn-helix transcriptional regulator [Pyrinomonadaceae bacterium]|nr:helix-turn-helix transcriptional regulator [Phycisphaerales bacterium]